MKCSSTHAPDDLWRIAWLVRGDETYGVRRAVLSLVEAVSRQGHEPIVVCLEAGEQLGRACAARGAKVQALHLPPLPGLAGTMPDKLRGWAALRRYEQRAIPAVVETLRGSDVHAVHVLWPNLVRIGAGVARNLGSACVWEMPNVLGASVPLGLSRWFYQWRCWRGNVVVLANSACTAASLGRVPVQPHVLHLGADETRFDLQRVQPITRAALNIPSTAVVLGIVGRIDPSKGQDRVLKAMLNMVTEGVDLHLVLLGGAADERYVARLRGIATEGDAAHRLHLFGEVNDPERYYGLIDVAVNNQVGAEAFGLSVVEAMLMGRPVAVHALGGPAETVIDGKTGWHVVDPSVSAWTAALRRLLADQPRWLEMGAAARQHANNRYTATAQARRYLAVLRETVRGESP